MGHKHAANMMLYAQDAMETDKPWDRWQHKVNFAGWVNVDGGKHPCWFPDVEYRRKPRTITIGGIEVPEPMREAPKFGVTYYFPAFMEREMVFSFDWHDDCWDMRNLDRGMAHATKEAAIAHAKALILASGGKV